MHPARSLAQSAGRYAAAEGIDHLADDVASRARRALNSPTVREAARSRHWRELYAGAEVSGRFLEGFIDLLYEVPDGSFVVVDYKTHASDERPDLHHKPGYRLQIAAYALMIAESTGSARFSLRLRLPRPRQRPRRGGGRSARGHRGGAPRARHLSRWRAP